MRQTVKKLFDWTESDIAAWERIRQKGLWHFIGWYGMLAFGGAMFSLTGLVTFFAWFRTSGGLANLLFQLGFAASACLLGGLITSLVTWWMEESIYRKIMRSRLLH